MPFPLRTTQTTKKEPIKVTTRYCTLTSSTTINSTQDVLNPEGRFCSQAGFYLFAGRSPNPDALANVGNAWKDQR